MRAEAAGRHVEVFPLPDVYPQCHPVLLVKSLLDREVAPGGNVLDEGVIVLPLAAVRGAAEALLDDRAVTHAVLTVAGDAVVRPGIFRVAVGTPMRDVAQYVGLTAPVTGVVCGGPLTGVALGNEHAVVTAEVPALLMFATTHHAAPTSCSHCGWCVEDCPVGVDPTALMNLESERHCHVMERQQLDACIACGLCSHVCPARLPLAETIRRVRMRHVLKKDTAGAAES
jgi:electron transport complex protein RnfC